MQRVAIYCRLSDEDRNKTDTDQDSRSIQTQKTMLIDKAIKEGWEIYNIYSDDDYTGTDSNRPEYKRILEDAERGKFDIILCKSQSRFTRDMEHVERYINGKFQEWGVRFISILDNADTDSYGNKKSRQINGLVNQWYIEDLSHNVQSSFIARKKKGMFIGSFASYGYLKDPNDCNKLIVDPVAAEIVKWIFESYKAGKSLEAIAKRLNEKGILCPAEYKKIFTDPKFPNTLGKRRRSYSGQSKWQSSSIHYILTKEVYMGDLVQNKSKTVNFKTHKRVKTQKEEWIRSENTHEAIIDRDTFDIVNRMMKGKTRPSKTGQYNLFTGKLVCGTCNHNIVMNSARDKDNRYYSCYHHRVSAKECPKGISVAEKRVVEVVKAELQNYIDGSITPECLADRIERVNSLRNSKEDIERQIEENEDKIKDIIKIMKSLYTDKVNNIVSDDDFCVLNQAYVQEKAEFVKYNETLRKKLEELSAEIGSVESDEKRSSEKISKAKEILSMDTLTRSMVEELIDYIKIWEGSGWGQKKYEIHWLF